MATRVSLFRSSGALYVSKAAAIRDAVKTAFDGIEPDDPTVDPASLVSATAVDVRGTEIVGTVDPDNPDHVFFVIPLSVPEGWEPEHELSMPSTGWVGSWQADRNGHESRQAAFRRMAQLNDLADEDALWDSQRTWWAAVQSGGPIHEESTDTFTFEGNHGIVERCQPLPVVLITPTTDEIRDAMVCLADYRTREAARVAFRQEGPQEAARDEEESSGPQAMAMGGETTSRSDARVVAHSLEPVTVA